MTGYNEKERAVTVAGLSEDEIDAIGEAARRTNAGEDGIDFFQASIEDGTVTVAGRIDIVLDALDVMEDESSCDIDPDVCNSAWGKLDGAYLRLTDVSL